MANQYVAGVTLGTGSTLAHTVAASPDQVVRILKLSFANLDSSVRAVNVWFKPKGIAIIAEHRVINTSGLSSLDPGETLKLILFPFLKEGDEIHWGSDVASVVRAQASVEEVSDSEESGSKDFINVPAQFVNNATFLTILTVDTSKASQQLFLGFCNQDTVTREIQVRAGSGTLGDEDTLLNGSDSLKIEAGETWYLSEEIIFLPTGGTVQVQTDATNKVVVFGGMLQKVI